MQTGKLNDGEERDKQASGAQMEFAGHSRAFNSKNVYGANGGRKNIGMVGASAHEAVITQGMPGPFDTMNK